MKKLLVILVVALLTICLFAGCTKSATSIGREHGKEILRCFDESNIADLKDMFCEKIANTHNLDEELSEAIELYKGKSVSYKKNFLVADVESIRDGIVTNHHMEYTVDDIITDLGFEYKIAVGEYLVYEANPDYVGIIYLKLLDENDNVIAKVGEVLH